MRTFFRFIVTTILIITGVTTLHAQVDRPYYNDDEHLIFIPKKTVLYSVGPLNTKVYESERAGEKWIVHTMSEYSKENRIKVKTDSEVPVIGFVKSDIELPRYDIYIVKYNEELCYLPSENLPDNTLLETFNRGISNRYEELKQEITEKSNDFLYGVYTKALAASERRAFLESSKKAYKDSVVRAEIAKKQTEVDGVYYAWESANQTRKNTAKYLLLHRAFLEEPNTASGCGYYMYFTNTSNKTIKYLDWTGNVYNAVNDMVSCTIRRTSVFSGRVTGPIEPGQSDRASWDAIIYNWSAETMKLSKIVITYMDGSKKALSSNEINSVTQAPGRTLSESTISTIRKNSGKEIDKEIQELKDIEIFQTMTSNAKFSNSRLLKEETELYRELEELTRELNQIRERNCLPKWKDAPKEVRSLVTLI